MAEEMSPGLTALTALMQEQNNISNEGGKTIKQVVDEARRANELQKAANAQGKNNADKEYSILLEKYLKLKNSIDTKKYDKKEEDLKKIILS